MTEKHFKSGRLNGSLTSMNPKHFKSGRLHTNDGGITWSTVSPQTGWSPQYHDIALAIKWLNDRGVYLQTDAYRHIEWQDTVYADPEAETLLFRIKRRLRKIVGISD
jgi:hypothetical protein